MTSSDDIGALVKLAGRRPMPDQARVSAARAEWTRIVKARNRSLFRWTLTTAAIVVLGVGYTVAPPPASTSAGAHSNRHAADTRRNRCRRRLRVQDDTRVRRAAARRRSDRNVCSRSRRDFVEEWRLGQAQWLVGAGAGQRRLAQARAGNGLRRRRGKVRAAPRFVLRLHLAASATWARSSRCRCSIARFVFVYERARSRSSPRPRAGFLTREKSCCLFLARTLRATRLRRSDRPGAGSTSCRRRFTWKVPAWRSSWTGPAASRD
jgi:hypothetical protein